MRHEFSKQTKREALRRSGGLCEAEGEVYGLAPGQRCNFPLSQGVEFDHYPIRAADGGGNGLDNIVAVCPVCHRHKSRTFDTPMAAKGKRLSDRHNGIRPPSKLRSRGFAKSVPQHSATRPIRKHEIEEPT